MLWDLLWRWALISALAFGGGQSALPLVERISVTEAGWISASDFGTALAFTYVTPGPVLVIAPFIGYHVAGLAGAAVATIGVFTFPWILATLAAYALRRFMSNRWLRGFGRGAGPAMVGLLLVAAYAVGVSAFTAWIYPLVALAALALSIQRRVHVFFVILGSAAIGIAYGLATGVG